MRYASEWATVATMLSLWSCGGSEGGPTTPSDDPASKAALILISPGADTLNWISATRQLSAAVLNNTGLTLQVPVTWSSSATNVASVSSAGLVTAVGAGTTSVVAKVGVVSGTATVVVRQVPATVTKVSGDSQTATVGALLSAPLVVEVKDQGGTLIPAAKLGWTVSQGGGKLETSSSETDASGRGQAVWRLGSAAGGQSVQVTSGSVAPVTFGAVGERLVADNVTLTPAGDTLDALGDTLRLTVVVKAKNGVVIPGAQVSFTSSNPSVATVSAAGLVTAITAGTTSISAQSDAKADTSLVVVRQVPAALVKASGDSQSGLAGANLTAPLVVEVRDARANPVEGVSVVWSVTAGGGSVSPATGTTASAGRAQATWRLGSVLGAQAVQASVTGLTPVTFSAQGTRPPVASVELLPALDTARVVGDTVRFTAAARDASGNAISGVTLAFLSTDTAVASVNAQGLATARATGTTEIVVSAESKADTSTLLVGSGPLQAPVLITGVNPSVLLEGSSATIAGSGFAPVASGNRVSIGGAAVTVTAASATSLTITVPTADCQPPRQAQLTVWVENRSGTRTVGVTPRSQVDLDLPLYWYRYTYSGNGCLNLPGNASGGEFLIGVVSTSQVASTLTPIMLRGTPGDPTVFSTVSAPAAVSEATVEAEPATLSPWRPPMRLPPGWVRQQGPAGQIAPRLEDPTMMARNEVLRRELGPPSAAWAAGRAVPQPVAAGDTLRIFADFRRTCSTSGQVRAVVRLVGTHAIWLEDVENPSGTFTNAELADLDAFYGSKVRAVHDEYFGGLSDVDHNGRVLILMTKNVNQAKVAGWATVLDLYPTSQCSTSNQAEIFFAYVPDPAGLFGWAPTKESTLNAYPGLIAHEITHLVQYSASLFGGAGAKKSWQMEGGANLAQQLVAYRVFGHGSGQDLDFEDYSPGGNWHYWAWVNDMFLFFGWDNRGDGSGRVAGAPEECSWVGNVNEGNSGPCIGDPTYGVPSMVLRYAMDRWGDTYPGGEQALMRQMTQSSTSGFSSLTDVSNWRIEKILADFYIALWADGRVFNAGGMKSWNLYDVLGRYPANRQLQPHSATSASPQQSASIRAGSTLYLLWGPTGALAPTSIKVTTPGGSTTPSNISVWALRLR